MEEKMQISGFADEICAGFDRQLEVVAGLGMKWICLRAADGKNIADYSLEEAEGKLLPRLRAAEVGVSSLGSPIGKVPADDRAAFADQLGRLDELCRIAKLLNCGYIRVFSFYIPQGKDPGEYREVVLEQMRAFVEVAERHRVTLLHENEKDIYGDTGARCRDVLDSIASPWLKAAYDPANFVQCGEDPVACWELLEPDIAYIHIKDAVAGSGENVVCGTGDGQIPLLLGRAKAMGYEGFLTMEPHLVLFDTLQSLEQEDAGQVIRQNRAADGAEGYRMQYEALTGILNSL